MQRNRSNQLPFQSLSLSCGNNIMLVHALKHVGVLVALLIFRERQHRRRFLIGCVVLLVLLQQVWLLHVCHVRRQLRKKINCLTCRSTTGDVLHSSPSSATAHRWDAANSKGGDGGLNACHRAGTGGCSDQDGSGRRHRRRRGKHELPAVVVSGHCEYVLWVRSQGNNVCQYLQVNLQFSFWLRHKQRR